MILNSKHIKHKGVRKFWESQGKDTSGIQPGHAKVLSLLLLSLRSAANLRDVSEGLRPDKRLHPMKPKKDNRYSLEVNGNYRLVFVCDDPDSGVFYDIDYVDYH